ncbi:MAG: SDR family NAD(P)-dependent oxidoreductase, partial [bacterium]
MWCARYAVPEMKKLDKGKIINISSIGSLVGLENLAAYSASKGGMNSLTRQMAIQFADDNICVNAIAPGIIKTPIQENIPEEMRKFHIQQTPLNRLGEPKEIATLALFLGSD